MLAGTCETSNITECIGDYYDLADHGDGPIRCISPLYIVPPFSVSIECGIVK
jgi:hypothetical protein